ncbi:hypothetical protein H5410_034568 [Solanum commersonii]|uniref:Uncharacterized protein n=1 Tax=Solanum commersonii TaxID=4109 RepID=A0A9J5YWE5_SOLCO|nr:hypothetical protein H5410_034568 [Solanum commersonii]
MVQHRRGTAVVQAAPLHKEAEREQYTTRQTTGIRARVSSGGGLLASGFEANSDADKDIGGEKLQVYIFHSRDP